MGELQKSPQVQQGSGNTSLTKAWPVKVTDGIDEVLVSATGRLLVETQGGAAGGTASVDDAAFSTAVDSGTPIMGVVTADAVDSGDVGVVAMTTTRALHTTIRDSAGDSAMDDANNALRVNVVAGSGSGTEYVEDAAAAANPQAPAVTLIRQDTPATLTDANGDNVAQRGTNYGAAYSQIVTSAGAFVDTFGGGTQYTEGDADATITGTAALMEVAANVLQPVQGTVADGLLVNLGTNNDVTVTGTVTANAGTNLNTSALNLETTQTSVLTAVQLIDDIVYTDDTSTHATGTSKGALIMGAATPTDTSVNANDIGAIGMTTDRRMFVEATQSGTWNVTNVSGTVSLPTGAATSANQTTMITALQLIDDAAVVLGTATYTEATSTGLAAGAVRRDADTTLVNNTNEWGPLQMDANGRLKVEAFSGETLPVSLTSTTVTGTVATTNAIVDGWDNAASDGASISGDVAHDTADAGEPVKIGGTAVSGSASPTSVASGDRTRAIFNQHGIPYSIAGHPNLITREYDFGTGAQTDVNLAAAAVAADERIYVTRFEALCDQANSVAVSVRAGFGAASVPAASSSGVSGMIASHPGVVAGSGIICGNGSGLIAVGAAGEEPRITTSAATSGNLHVVISYFLIDETP